MTEITETAFNVCIYLVKWHDRKLIFYSNICSKKFALMNNSINKNAQKIIGVIMPIISEIGYLIKPALAQQLGIICVRYPLLFTDIN